MIATDTKAGITVIQKMARISPASQIINPAAASGASKAPTVSRLCRKPNAAPRFYRFVGYTLDTVERTVTGPNGEHVPLTGLDFQLLKYFVEHAGDILDRNVLCEETRGRDAGPMDRFLDVQISRLRLRLNDAGRQPLLIKTVRGAGYVFSADVIASNV